MYNIKFSEVTGRLREVLNTKSDDDIAKSLEITPQAFFSFKKQNEIPSELLVRFCLLHQISIDWLVKGEQEKTSDYVNIPIYNPKIFTDERVNEPEHTAEFIAFKSEWLKSEFSANKANLYLFYIEDDSMEPTLKNGDVVIVDKKDNVLDRDGLYLLRVAGASFIKRIQRLPGSSIRMLCDNSAYQTIEVKTDQIVSGEILIIGRIVWSGRKL
ncbi:MAG: LexA family transcriptional regulator [Candidatus Kuenenia sp.]|nr:LexA family transcriptional regulator [Candidatus Kuenenia hertensis]